MALTRVVAGNTANASDMNQALDMLNGNRSDGLTFGSDIVGYGANLTLNTLPVPAAPVITQGGSAGSTNYTYEVVAVNSHGDGVPSATTQTTTGALFLNGSNYNIVTWTVVQGATYYRIVRTASSGNPGSTGQITTVANGFNANGVAVTQPTIGTQSFNDTGYAATAYTASTLNPGGSGAGMSQIQKITTAGSQASVTFSGISGNYTNLLILWQARSDTVATSTAHLMQFNGDSTSKYNYNYVIESSGAAPTGSGTGLASSITIGSMAAASSASGSSASGRIDIPNYTGTTFKKNCVFQTHLEDNPTDGSSFIDYVGGGEYNVTPVAITSILFKPTAGNYVNGSVFTLYGLQ